MKQYKLFAGTYDFSFYLVMTEDRKIFSRYIQKKLGDKDFKMEDYFFGEYENRGGVYFRGNRCPVLWIPKPPKKPREFATLSHEIFHMATYICKWANIPLTDSSEEAYAHLISHITNEIFRKIFPPKNR